MKRFNRKMRMVRASEALLPMVFLIASLLGRSAVAASVYVSQWSSLLLGLAAARGLRQAFSEQPSIRRVQGSVKMALMLQCVGAVLLLPILWLCRSTGLSVPIWYAIAGALLNIEHVFYEYLYATGDGSSAGQCRFITAVLLLGGILMTSLTPHTHPLASGILWPMIAAALAAGVSAVIAWNVGGALKGKRNDQVVRCAPPALIQSALYPAASIALSRIPAVSNVFTHSAAPFFTGLIAYELCRAPFRRGPSESDIMNRALLIASVASIALAIISRIAPVRAAAPAIPAEVMDTVSVSALWIAVGCACGFAMFGNIRRS